MSQEPMGEWEKVSDRLWRGHSVQGEAYVWAVLGAEDHLWRGSTVGWCVFALYADGDAVCDATLHPSAASARFSAETLLTQRAAIRDRPPDAHGLRTLDLGLDRP